MFKHFFSLLILVLLFVFFSVQPVPAQEDTGTEDDLLQMYFTEDELVEVAARFPKPMIRVAENVSVITAADIERMNAHNVAEILNRLPGVFIQFNGRGFNQSSTIFIQDSDYEHVLVLLDGIRWNSIYGGMAELNSIPVQIIDRIEVIKGPASSTWGSSLGGVVNIITGNTGNSTRPKGLVSASYGEKSSQEYFASLAGRTGHAGYFVSAGSQSSDGFLHNRMYDRENIYGKFSLDLPHASLLTMTTGYSEPELRFFDWPESSFGAKGRQRHFWSKLNFDTTITDKLNINVNAFRYEQKFVNNYYSLPDNTSYYDDVSDNLNKGFGSQLTWQTGGHLLVFGGEFERTSYDDESNIYYDESWGLYLNDTITFGSITLIPGIRYDYLSTSADMVSPGLGVTWQMSEQTLLRFLVSRGFRKPYIYDIYKGGGSGLDSETVTSYQAGVESTALNWCRLKANFFEHRIKDEWNFDSSGSLYNGGKAKRYGYELELETAAWHYFSVLSSFSYVYTDYYGNKKNDDTYTGKLTLLYQHPQLFTAELFGRYMWWNEHRADNLNSDYGTMICDLTVTKEFQLSEQTAFDLFFTVHNLFDGRDYWISIYDNAHRWVEAGLRFNF